MSTLCRGGGWAILFLWKLFPGRPAPHQGRGTCIEDAGKSQNSVVGEGRPASHLRAFVWGASPSSCLFLLPSQLHAFNLPREFLPCKGQRQHALGQQVDLGRNMAYKTTHYPLCLPLLNPQGQRLRNRESTDCRASCSRDLPSFLGSETLTFSSNKWGRPGASLSWAACLIKQTPFRSENLIFPPWNGTPAPQRRPLALVPPRNCVL